VETQIDYEAEVHLAVFKSAASAKAAGRALRQAGIEFTRGPLDPGRYQLADPRLRTYTVATLWAAAIGAIVGALIGIGVAVVTVAGALIVALWFALAGAGCGAIIGGLIGLQAKAQYDEDVAKTIDVAPDGAILITTHATTANGGGVKARKILRQSGAVAFLDVPSYERREVDEAVISQEQAANRA
jgi:hypothetical protein